MIIIGLLSVSLKHVQMSTLECYSTFSALSSGLKSHKFRIKEVENMLSYFGRGFIKFWTRNQKLEEKVAVPS